VVFDPPYYDFIAYSELSEFFRGWLKLPQLGGAPLLPDETSPQQSFAKMLGDALVSAARRLKDDGPLAFTFHSTDNLAWSSVAKAIEYAGFQVTALWPIKCDSHMGHHSREGNCEWDVVVVCRTLRTGRENVLPSVDAWLGLIRRRLRVGQSDRRNMELAIQHLAPLFDGSRA
jgi:adenine-specific DNA methylase